MSSYRQTDRQKKRQAKWRKTLLLSFGHFMIIYGCQQKKQTNKQVSKQANAMT